MIIRFLKSLPKCPPDLEENFLKSIKTKDFDLFYSIFKKLSAEHLIVIDNGEQLNAISIDLTEKPVKITPAFLKNIRDFIRDDKFSGVISISDGASIHTIASDNITDPQVPFAMHSIGKVFTGALVLRLVEEGVISEDDLHKPIQLDESVVKALPPAVRSQLAKTTLHDVMIHRGRLGDYLKKYTNTIQKAIDGGSPVPRVNAPKDFLAFADEEIVPLDKLGPEGYSYSNLGILLVGLSIEHLYNQKTGENIDYSEILRRHVLAPAGVVTFQSEMPEGAQFNKEDSLAPHISGSPGGGYWSTTGDLFRLGHWLGEKSKEVAFLKLLKSYGGEFYNNGIILHGGEIESSSAYLAHRISNGLTIAVMSDMHECDTHLGQAGRLARIIQEKLLEK